MNFTALFNTLAFITMCMEAAHTESSECQTRHKSIAKALECITQGVVDTCFDNITNQNLWYASEESNTMDFTEYNDYCGDPDMRAATQPDAAYLDDLEAEIVDHSDPPIGIGNEDAEIDYPAAHDNDSRAHMYSINVFRVIAIDGGVIYKSPEDVWLIFYNNDEELKMELMKFLAELPHCAGLVGAAGGSDPPGHP